MGPPALASLAAEPAQQGIPAGSAPGRVLVGRGRWDRLTPPTQARRTLAAFPDATLHRFPYSGHFPQVDDPAETARVVLGATP